MVVLTSLQPLGSWMVRISQPASNSRAAKNRNATDRFTTGTMAHHQSILYGSHRPPLAKRWQRKFTLVAYYLICETMSIIAPVIKQFSQVKLGGRIQVGSREPYSVRIDNRPGLVSCKEP